MPESPPLDLGFLLLGNARSSEPQECLGYPARASIPPWSFDRLPRMPRSYIAALIVVHHLTRALNRADLVQVDVGDSLGGVERYAADT